MRLLTGTSVPEAYTHSWDDELISLSEFAGALGDAVGGVSTGLDTRARGVPVVVHNALSIPREDVVEADLVFEGTAPPAVRVLGPDGKETPAQVVRASGSSARVVFLARVPPLGFSVFDVRPATSAVPAGGSGTTEPATRRPSTVRPGAAPSPARSTPMR